MSFTRHKANSNGKTGQVPVVRSEPGVHPYSYHRGALASCVLTTTVDDPYLLGILKTLVWRYIGVIGLVFRTK